MGVTELVPEGILIRSQYHASYLDLTVLMEVRCLFLRYLLPPLLEHFLTEVPV